MNDLEAKVLDRIDEFLKDVSGQSLVDSNKIIDFCLDIRQLYQKDVDDSDQSGI
jgi:hypothetical protein